MKINSIKIENLFEIFNYDISFKEGENILIITGSNGFGKTMILNIIYNLFNRNFSFFPELVFNNITVYLDNNIRISIVKYIVNGVPQANFTFFEEERYIEEFVYSASINSEFEKRLQLLRTEIEERIREREESGSNKILHSGSFSNLNSEELDTEPKTKINLIKSERTNSILNSFQVHLIKEQRLFKKADNIYANLSKNNGEQTVMIETIQMYAEELKQLIIDFRQRSYSKTQNLDSSYPKRLMTEKAPLKKDEYERRYSLLKEKQAKLSEFGLYESKQEYLDYYEEDAKALTVYIKDLEQKLEVFDDLLEKLELFTTILNERRFTFKTINVDRGKGFYFKTNKGKELELGKLSSGEQHEVVILYELIFKTKPNNLVLIDEPELSLHITWQKEFLNDLLKIIEIQKIQVMVATHSPSIINDRWDLVHTLENPS